MHLIIIVLLICFFLFLYILHFVSRDDFVIVRKDIQMDRIFNMAFLTGLVALFFARLFYVLFNPQANLLNPIGFLAFPYFPGLSLIGAIIGGSLFIYFYARAKKMPIGKIFDLFTISFMGTLPVGFLGVFILLFGKTSALFNFLFLFSIIILFIFRKIIYPFSAKGEIKDGSLGLIFIAIFSFLYFLTKMFLSIRTFSFVEPENIVLLICLFSSLVFILNQEIMDKFLAKK